MDFFFGLSEPIWLLGFMLNVEIYSNFSGRMDGVPFVFPAFQVPGKKKKVGKKTS